MSNGPAWKSESSHQKSLKRIGIYILALSILFLLVASHSSIKSQLLSSDAALFSSKKQQNDSEPAPLILIRTVEDNGAGIGSVIAQLLRSVVMAIGVNAKLYAVESYGLHNYNTVALLDTFRDTNVKNVDFSRVCRLSRYLTQADYGAYTNALCEAIRLNQPLSSVQHSGVTRLIDRNCSVVIHDEPWEVDYQLATCTWKWTSQLMGNPQPRKVKGKTTVGLHIRWGDMASGSQGADVREEYRSILIPTANRVLKGLQTCLGDLDVKTYMENHNDTMLANLDHPSVVVDTHDDIGDMVDLAQNEIMIVAGSGYTMTTHQISRGGLTVVPNFDPNARFWEVSGTNGVLKWQEVGDADKRDCDLIRRTFEQGKLKGSQIPLEGSGYII
ncbi:hypothetical protein T439DRAFT_332446 [Meredithblackwellia eburnea MCA 4105]